MLTTLLMRAEAQGVARVGDPEMAARLFLGPILTYALLDGLLAAGEPAVPSPERLNVMIDLFMQMIAHND